MQYKFSKDLYTKQAVFKSAYQYTNQYYIHLDIDENYYIVTVEQKDDSVGENFEKEFQNELIEQMNREMIANSTKNIREIIMARALSSTFIYQESEDTDNTKLVGSNTNEEKATLQENSSIINDDDVMKDWYDVYGK